MKKFLGQKIFGGQKNFGVKKFWGSKKFCVQKCLIYCWSLILKFHAILLPRSGVRGFVSVERRGERVFIKINEMALKVPSQKKRRKHERINIKLLLLIFLWLGSRESGTLGDLVNMTFLTLAKGKVIKSPKKPRYTLIQVLTADLITWSGSGGLGISVLDYMIQMMNMVK